MDRVYIILDKTGSTSGITAENLFLLVPDTPETPEIPSNHFKGIFSTLSALQQAFPTANSGDYAQVDAGAGSNVKNYNYDLDDGWVLGSESTAGALNTDELPEGSVNKYFTDARVRATVATGLSDTAGTMSPTDPLIVLFGKIKKALSDFGVALGLKADKTSQSAITYGASVAIDFTQIDVVRTLALTGNVTFTTSNRTATKEKVFIITASGADRTLTFPAGWIWTSPIPTSVLSGKTGVLYLYAKGTAETDILASYAPQTN